MDDSNKRPDKTVFCFIKDGFDKSQNKSLGQVKKMIKENGANVCDTLEEVAKFLNGAKDE